MRKHKNIFAKTIIGLCLVFLTGCHTKESQALNDLAMSGLGTDSLDSTIEKHSDGNGSQEDEKSGTEDALEEAEREGAAGQEGAGKSEAAEQEETKQDKAEQNKTTTDGEGEVFQVPTLPDTGGNILDFVPEGWKILDSVELDFNEDGIIDYVGVLESVITDDMDDWTYPGAPRILFAIASDGQVGYRLDFQNINLIRTRGEGGIFGDPYMPLTAEGKLFTTHAYGGSAWRWSEDYTYTYLQGVWLLTSSEDTYGYGGYTTSYSKNDWVSGIGIRKERSSEFSDMEENWGDGEGWDSEKYDLEYELPLDEPVTLELAGKRWWLAKNRVTDWEVASVTCAAGVEISEDKIKRPEEAYLSYCDEDCVLYTFLDQESDFNFNYLAMYCLQDRALSVLAQDHIRSETIYKDKIYYATEIVETVKYKTWQDGREQITEEADTVGVRLNRMALDGTGKEMVFEYRYPEEEQQIRENRIPYLSLIYEISRDEIVAEVYIGNEPHPFYRMKTDGSGAKKIGQVPMEKQ